MRRREISSETPPFSKRSTATTDEGTVAGDNGGRLGPGERVGRYIIDHPIGGGGMGEVYLASDPTLGRNVALKLIRGDLLGRKGTGAFLREARTTARFNHPNIVVIHEVGAHQGQPFLALEYLDGPTLKEWVRDSAPTLLQVLEVTCDVAEALVAAHERGIIHRDLKPANIVVARDGRARVVDFGLAATLEDRDGRVCGTPRYMAPEQRRGEIPTDAVDVWALGLILQELLACGLESTERSEGPMTPPASAGDSLESATPPALTSLLQAANQHDPALRPSAAVFRDTLAGRIEELRVEQDLARTRQLLGREAERGRLLEEAVALREGGRGGILGIEGEAGLGKTLLLLDFSHRAQANGLHVVSGSADVINRHTPFHAWSDVLRELLETGRRGRAATSDALRAHLPDDLHPFLPIVETVMRISDADSEVTLVDLETRAEVTSRVLVELMSRVAAKPVVVLIDDWQWADSASWRLARSVVLKIPHLLLVLSYRPLDPASAEKTRLEQLPRFWSITLPPLADHAVRRIVENRAPGAESTGELARLVVHHAAGNPLFAEELTALVQHSGTGGLSSEPTLQSVLKRRLDALPPEVLDVLLSASVVGRRFDRDLLQELHDPPVVRAALDRLLGLGLIQRADTGYAFWHDLTRSVTYGRLSVDERRRRHRVVASTLEKGGGEAARQYFALANHWHEAGDLERAVRHSELAAEQALKTGTYQEAARFLRHCLRFWSRIPSDSRPADRSIRWRRLLAESYYALGQLKEAREEALRALALAGREFPTSRFGYRVATAGLLLQALLLTRRIPERRLRESEGLPWQLESARSLGVVATTSWFFNEDDPTHYAALASFCEARRSGASRTLVHASSRLGFALGLRGWAWAGARLERIAREVAAELDDGPAIAYACMTDALYRVGVGDWDRVQDEVDECQRICEDYRDDTNWCNAQAIRYWAHRYRGMSDEAWEDAQNLSERAETSGNDQHRGWGARDVALEMLDAGDPEGAQRTLEDALGLFRSAGRRIELIPARGALAVAWMRLGEQDRAVEEVNETLGLLSRSKGLISHAILEGCSGVTEVLLTAEGEGWPHRTPAGWRRAVSQALGTLRIYSSTFPIGVPRFALWRGVAAKNRGRNAKAVRCWQRGLKVAGTLGLGRDVRLLSERLAAGSGSGARVS